MKKGLTKYGQPLFLINMLLGNSRTGTLDLGDDAQMLWTVVFADTAADAFVEPFSHIAANIAITQVLAQFVYSHTRNVEIAHDLHELGGIKAIGAIVAIATASAKCALGKPNLSQTIDQCFAVVIP